MATPLPMQGKLELPIQWSVSIKKITQEVGSYSVETTIGLNPEIATVNLLWRLHKSDIKTLLDVFRASKWVGLYEYDDPVEGTIILRPTTNYSYSEGDTPEGLWTVAVDFRRVG